MKCPFCQTEATEGVGICPTCHRALPEMLPADIQRGDVMSAANEAATPMAPQYPDYGRRTIHNSPHATQMYIPASRRRSSYMKWIYIGVSFVVALALIIIVIYMFSGPATVPFPEDM